MSASPTDPQRLGHPRRRRRHPARRRGQAGDRLVGRLAVGPGAPGQHARVPHRALRRRRAAPPRGARAAPARVGRLRPLPQGAGGRRPVVRRAHRPPAERRPRPVGLPRLVGRALQGAAPRRAARDGHRDGGDLPDRALHLRPLPRAGAARRPAPARHRGGARALPHEEGRARDALRAGGRGAWPTAPPTTRTPRAAPSWSGSRTSRTAARAGATPPRSRRTTTRPPTSPTPAPTGTPTPPTSPRRTRASWSGRSTGRCAGPSSTSTSSRPAWTTRRPARRSPSATSWSRRSSGCRGRPGSATASWASPACRRCRRPRAVRPPPRTRCRCWRRRSCAGSTCAATPSRPSTSTSAPRSSGSTTSGTRWPARPRTPTSATPRCSPGSARRPRPPARCRRRRSSYRSACSPRSPTSPPARPSRSAGSSAHRRRRTSAAASTRRWPGRSEYVDPADRTTVRETPDEAHARRAGRPPARVAAAAARRARRAAASSTPSRRWSTACPSWRAGMALDDKPTDEVKADQKEFFGLLYRLLVDAERGPRLPTLVMALGAERVRSLLGG